MKYDRNQLISISGFIALLWTATLKYYAMELTKQKRTVVGLSSTNLFGNSSPEGQVPWLTYLKSKALW